MARKGSSYETADRHPHFTGKERSSEARLAYLGHIIPPGRPKASMQHMLLGHNCLSVADAATWRLVWKGASCPYGISCIFPSLLKLGAPRIWEQAGKRGTLQCQSTLWYMVRLYLLPASPEGPELAVLGDSVQKKTSPLKAGKEMHLCLRGWCI